MDRWKSPTASKKLKHGEGQHGESQKNEVVGARKGRKVAKHYIFPLCCGAGGAKSRLAKAAGAELARQKKHEKLHAVVARSTFASESVENTPFVEHFWKLRYGKGARPLCHEAHLEVKSCKMRRSRTAFGS